MLKRFTTLSIASFILLRQIIPISKLILDFPLNDFSVYLDGTKATLAGKNPYLLKFFDRYNYPPAATIFFMPLTKIDVNTVEFIFTTLSVISLWLVVSMSLSVLTVHLHWTTRLLLFALVLKTFPVKLTLVLGQINIIILFLVIGSWFMEKRKKPLLGGMLLGLATAIKLTPGPLVLYFLIRKRWSFILWFLATVVVLNLFGIAFFGWPMTQYYYTVHLPVLLSETTPDMLNLTYMNQSLLALLGRLGIFRGLGTTIQYGIVALTTLLAVSKLKGFRFFSAFLIIVFLLLPSFVWQHHFVALIPAWLMLVSQAVKRPRPLWTLAAILGYGLLNVSMKDPYLPSRLHPLLASHFTVTAFFFLVFLLFPWTDPQKQ